MFNATESGHDAVDKLRKQHAPKPAKLVEPKELTL